MKRSSMVALMLALVGMALSILALAGCGGTTVKTTTKTTTTVVAPPVQRAQPTPIAGTQRSAAAQIARQCPANQGHVGCAIPPSAKPPRAFFAPPRGPLFPDVYEGQGQVDWSQVKAWQSAHGWRAAAIFKMGEFRLDFQAQRNAALTAALGFWRSGYWFVRNTGCGAEAQQIMAAAHLLHILIVSLDLEVPEASGYGACLSPILRAHGFIVVEYTSPGSNPGGVDTSDPLWIATFGSGFACIWTCQPVAWQFTDGSIGAVVSVPGVGNDDVNVDMGITKLGAPPPDPYALYLKIVFSLRFGQHASEYNTTKNWDHYHCLVPVRREVCKTTFFHLELLTDRLYFVAHHTVVHGHWVTVHTPRWSVPKGHPAGSRYAGMTHRMAQRR